MGMQLKEGNDDLAEASEINVTPFIDVMLVLLIIFMVAAPLATVDVKIDLPASSATPSPRPEKPIYLSIKEGGELYLGDDLVTRPVLGEALDTASGKDKEKPIFVRGDKGVEYAELMGVMDALREAGYLRIGLVGLETAAKP